jgi:hypothetical protein
MFKGAEIGNTMLLFGCLCVSNSVRNGKAVQRNTLLNIETGVDICRHLWLGITLGYVVYFTIVVIL